MNTSSHIPLKNLSAKMSTIGIRGRLFIGFAAITIVFLIAIGIALTKIIPTKDFANHVTSIDLPTYDAFIDLNSEVYQVQIAIQGLLLTGDQKFITENKTNWDNINQTVMAVDTISKKWTSDEYNKGWQEIKLLLVQLGTAQNKIENLLTSSKDKTVALNLLTTDVIPLQNRISSLLNTINTTGIQASGLLDIQSNRIHEGAQNITNNLDTLLIAEYVLSIIGILSAIIITTLTAKGILRHINIFRQHSSRIAAGDLTQNILIESNDEIGQLGNDLNIMTESLSTITKELTLSCANMVTTLDEVRHAIDAQSSGASEQASSINEITASISEIEKSSSQTMDKAKALGEVAERTREKGQLGLEAVEQSVQGMKAVRDKVQMIAQTILDLSNQTQQVGEITSVVNNLAQQSKMLALNASIEAAKAGEAGKGFAVVAVEVKNLAEQSEQSTAQVQKILEDIRHATEKAVMVTEEGTKGVDQGTTLVEQTGDVIRNLNDVIHEATIASQQIEAAIRQEGAGIEQITAGMNEINQVTSSFVNSVKQTTEAMGNLSAIAKNLKSHVDTYKV